MSFNLNYFIPVICISLGIGSCKNNTNNTKDQLGEEPTKEYVLVWADEFDGTGKPDPLNWNYETGFIRNNEAQYYTNNPKNVRVEDGFLIIEAHKEQVKNEAFVAEEDKNWIKNTAFGEYTSASLTTKDLNEWKYGKVSVRAKLPEGTGTWPAIWMLGENWKEAGWPTCGEIDIMEHVGYEKDSIYGTVHTEAFNHIKGTEVGKAVFIENPYEDFHEYSIEWTPEKIDFILDGTVYHQFKNLNKTDAEWPFDQAFHLKLNLAIGGSWGGLKGIDESIFPQQMVIDYARVYQLQ
ncbi:glycoside hydrolase family 16 protein [Maribacter sp. MMG018]|uniref:glycoside hydrolase family 16 protein n=1 Tax=Maribacter sp. MMG018 TaxID=2822688 RepID=UPI001B37AEDD|nr:glycoside hydrolase family 16 protein [Maribacter sp. MMG018]MBQ4914582.1 glycoside hydrolase family 16 protein [Maribacter sp. MMG018]